MPPSPTASNTRTLWVQVCGARGLPFDKETNSDHPSTYVKFIVNGTKYKTRIVEKTASPLWEETFEVPVPVDDVETECVEFAVWRRYTFSGNEKLATMHLSLSSLADGVLHDTWHPLRLTCDELPFHAELHLRSFLPTFQEDTESTEEHSQAMAHIVPMQVSQ